MSPMTVEIVYALPQRCYRLQLELPAGATVDAALRQVARLARPEACWQRAFLDSALAEARVGVWGELVDGGRRLNAGDRLELYRPLTTDPKHARLERARRQRGPG